MRERGVERPRFATGGRATVPLRASSTARSSCRRLVVHSTAGKGSMSAHSRPEGLRGRRRSVDDRAAAVAAAQHGVITLGQVRAAGMTPAMAATRVRSGVWVRVHPGTYRVRGAPETWRQRVVAACLAGDGAASHDTALALLLGWAREPLPVEITVPATRRPRLCGVVVHRARRLEEGDLARVDGIRVTRAHRTLLDVAGRYEPDELERLLDEVLRRGASPDRLRERLRDPAARTRKGAGTLRELVEHRCGDERVTESDLETGFLQLLRRFRVPRPVSQHEVRHSGRLVARVDFAYPESRVALELDGYRWHAGRTRFDADRTRQNALEALGWTVLRFTWRDVHDRPEGTVAVVWAVLGGRVPAAHRGRDGA